MLCKLLCLLLALIAQRCTSHYHAVSRYFIALTFLNCLLQSKGEDGYVYYYLLPSTVLINTDTQVFVE